MDAEKAADLLVAIDVRKAAAIMEHVDPGVVAQQMSMMEPQRAARLLETIAFDFSVQCMDRMEPRLVRAPQRTLPLLPPPPGASNDQSSLGREKGRAWDGLRVSWACRGATLTMCVQKVA